MSTRTILIILGAAALLALAAFLLIPLLSPPESASTAWAPDYWPTDEWRTSTPEEQGFDSAALAEHLLKLREDGVAIDSLLGVRNGRIFLEAYFDPYDGTFPHDMASVTKSITTTLIGIAATQGKIDLDAPMLSYFPDRHIQNVDARKQAITVRHLAGMTNGMESGCLNGDLATLDEMHAAPDWMQWVLDRKMARDPGKAFCYDSPGMHLLSGVLQEAAGMTEEQFARRNLFEPMGIHEWIWESDPQGYTLGSGDLDLLPRDAAKLGYLWLSGGVWEGRQIVPADWVKEAVTPHLHADGEDDYGYGWWVSEDSYWALGRGGQHVKVYPAYNAIFVVTAAEFDFDQLEPMLGASFKGADGPLPANPQGVAALEGAVRSIAQPAEPFPTGPLPAMAYSVSGVRYEFGADAANKLDLTALTFLFDDASDATLIMQHREGEETWPIGLQGAFRFTADGQAVRGYWSDENTFVLSIFDIGQQTYVARFEGSGLILTSQNVAGTFEAGAAPE
jgi:CubicO group peptidase (beta-lactamase class C family)